MKQVIIIIRGKPVIEIFESFDGSYWFATEKAWKQDSLINGRVYEKDQIFFGYVRLSHCPELAEFGYFSEAELKNLGWIVWKVDRVNWPFCPEVEVEEVPEQEPADGKRRPIFIYGAYSGGHCPAAERTEGHTRKSRQCMQETTSQPIKQRITGITKGNCRAFIEDLGAKAISPGILFQS
jgi:hypothetical protein